MCCTLEVINERCLIDREVRDVNTGCWYTRNSKAFSALMALFPQVCVAVTVAGMGTTAATEDQKRVKLRDGSPLGPIFYQPQKIALNGSQRRAVYTFDLFLSC
ncbi:hypothetical protein E2C01_058916 [Portunus trituberculatus]|uniref:Uncharacterized protein n=1 Tax=Portunus trituberculatus TaxID=210409 RepID=A0A5B7H4G7_PORTR|nr:hypothetical protein [Portunus trituberculatus]